MKNDILALHPVVRAGRLWFLYFINLLCFSSFHLSEDRSGSSRVRGVRKVKGKGQKVSTDFYNYRAAHVIIAVWV
jgi:hypothetical protein